MSNGLTLKVTVGSETSEFPSDIEGATIEWLAHQLEAQGLGAEVTLELHCSEHGPVRQQTFVLSPEIASGEQIADLLEAAANLLDQFLHPLPRVIVVAVIPLDSGLMELIEALFDEALRKGCDD